MANRSSTSQIWSLAALKEYHHMEQRHQDILTTVQRQGFVSIDELAQLFKVTPQTIRRDVNRLHDHGLVQRYHGGVSAISSVENLAYETRQVLNFSEKKAIAHMIAQNIPDHASLFINLGTTTEAVAHALKYHKGLKVITNNLHVAHTLSLNTDFEVIIAGGVVRSRDQGITGEAAIDLVNQFRVDFGIIGISGIDQDGALLDFDYQEVRVAQAIIQNSRKVFLGADHTKFGRNAMVHLGDISQISAVFTDIAPESCFCQMMSDKSVPYFSATPVSQNNT